MTPIGSFLNSFFLTFYLFIVFWGVYNLCHGMGVEVRGQLAFFCDNFLSFCVFWGEILGCQAWQQVSFLTEPSRWPASWSLTYIR